MQKKTLSSQAGMCIKSPHNKSLNYWVKQVFTFEIYGVSKLYLKQECSSPKCVIIQ